MAIIHIAMYDAVNSITRKYQTYSTLPDDATNACLDTAISAAASATLVKLFPKETARITDAKNADLPWARQACTAAGSDEAAGTALGNEAAKRILDDRATDKAPATEKDVGTQDQAMQSPDKYVYIPADAGKWQPDPHPESRIRAAVGYDWGKVRPFVISPEQFEQAKPPTPPAPSDPAYTALYDEVQSLGAVNSSTRKPHETFNGVFWAYDGTPSLCAPPRLYNQVALKVLSDNIARRPDLREPSGLIRYLTVIHTAMADVGIAAWEAKWREAYWRPVTAIQYGDDGNTDTVTDASWFPLGAPATNGRGPNFTPPFPAYPSGHAAFGGALFQVLREFWGENTSFVFVSDEFNGLNFPAGGGPARTYKSKEYSRLSEPEWENARSRIWLGIHWQIDADAGITQGNMIGKFVYDGRFLAR
jgi:hypothetical protein